MFENNKMDLSKGLVLNHPSQLFILFFTEMWERFSYYGMRALLVLFLTASLMDAGYGWERKDALELYALYTGLVYFTPMLGGFLADKFLGYRKAVIIGGITMALGHGFMALEQPTFFYLGLISIIIGNGLFKPNISSMVGQLYKNNEAHKDSAYTIFYMGINAGSFLGMLLCGYLGEKVGWNYGFGLAMVFMIAGVSQFWFSSKLFGNIGLLNKNEIGENKSINTTLNIENKSNNRFVFWCSIGIIIALMVYFLIPHEASKSIIKSINIFIPPLIFGVVTTIIGFLVSDPTLTKVEKDKVVVIIVFTFFTIFFWWAFEQSGGSMTIFASEYTDRTLTGNGATIFKIVNSMITVGAMAVISWVLVKLFKVTFTQVPIANVILASSFILIWSIVIWMLWREFQAETTEIQASWFSMLGSFFIITLSPLFSKFWDTKIIKSGAIKFGLGLILIGLGFAFLAFGSNGIPQGAKTASVSLIWLVLAYLLHTMGELCVSPVGLSYVSKLAPVRLIGILFGIWFVANFIASWAAGITGSYIDPIVEKYSMSIFFLIFTGITVFFGLVIIGLNPILKKMMHGVDD